MKILERVRDIILDPRNTWQTIKGEAVEARSLLFNYAAVLMLIPAISSLIGMTLVGYRLTGGNVVRAPFTTAFIGGVLGYFLTLVGIYVGALAVARIAAFFESKTDLDSVVKLIVYSLTPTWLVGIFTLVPGMGILSILGLYGIYLMVIGLPIVLETPAGRVAWFTVSILFTGMVISFVLTSIMLGMVYGPMYLNMMAR